MDAIPDTGADVSVMSERFAKSNVFQIDDDEQHRIPLEFVDGSTAKACGVVKDVAWRYGADEQTHPTDVYVLPKLPANLVLGYAFLRQTDAFVKHQLDFWHAEALGTGATSMLGIIRMLGKIKKRDRMRSLLIRLLGRAEDNRMDFSCEYRQLWHRNTTQN